MTPWYDSTVISISNLVDTVYQTRNREYQKKFKYKMSLAIQVVFLTKADKEIGIIED